MNYKTLLAATENIIKQYNLPWDADPQGDSVIINFNEAPYAPDGTFGLGLWLEPDTIESIEEQICNGQDNGFGRFDVEQFLDDMADARADGEAIPDNDTVRADAESIADHIEHFGMVMNEQEETWLAGERKRANDLASKIVHELVEPAAKSYFDFCDLSVETTPYSVDGTGTWWGAKYLYEYSGQDAYTDEEKVDQELLSAALQDWQDHVLNIGIDSSSKDGQVERYVRFSFRLPYAE